MYKVGIIGVGGIAALKWGEPGDAAPYNHAGGIHQSNRVELAALADLAQDRHEEFRRKWGASFPETVSYGSISDMCANQDLDIISVCVRGPHHFAVMMEVLEAKPKAIFLEKPPTCSLGEMDEITSIAGKLEIPITVSYSRHWAPSVLRMEELIGEGLIGDVEMVVAYCGGSILSFASHTTDLICQFAGYAPTAVFARGTTGNKNPKGYEPEPELISMSIEFENGVSGLQIGKEGEHGSFYCDVFGTEGRARTGIYIAPAAWDKKGKAIDLTERNFPDNVSPFKTAYEQIAGYLDGSILPACTNADWVAVNEIGFGAVESIRTDQRVLLPNANRTRKIFANG